MASNIQMEVCTKLKDFVANFVKIYEKTLNEYIERIENDIEKEGRTAKSFMSLLELGKNASEKFEGGAKGLYTFVCDILLKAVYASGVQNNRNNVKIILDHLYLFKNEPQKVRKELVEAGYLIFRSFECQFVEVTANETWERAMTKLAEDAVGRAINYYRKTHDDPNIIFYASLIVCGVISGQSKWFRSYFHTGHTVQIKRKNKTCKWNTGKLFSKVGLTDGVKYYRKINNTSNTAKFGHRLRLQTDDFGYCEEEPPQLIYTYILQQDKSVNDRVEALLTAINNEDYSVEKVEERMNALISSKVVDIKKFLKSLELLIENNFDLLKEIVQNNVDIRKDLNTIKGEVINIGHQTREIDTTTKEILHEVKRVSSNMVPIKIKKPIRNIQKHLLLFCGRKRQLEDIESRIKQKIIVVVCGLGGVGKTELALEYADKYFKDETFSVINIDASTEKTIEKGFKNIHTKLELKMLTEDGEPKPGKILAEESFENLDENTLIIFDNAKNYIAIKDFLPLTINNKPFILITSQNLQEWSSTKLDIQTMPLNGFEETEAIEFVKDSLKIKDKAEIEAIKTLTEKLHNFPLALSQAVAYIKQKNIVWEGFTTKKKLADYLKLYDENPRTFLDYRVDDNMKTIFKTLDITMDKIKDEDNGKLAINLLNYVSYFMPNDIPIYMFLHELAEGNEDKLVETINVLKKYAISHINENKLNIHGLVQKAVRLELKKDEKEIEYLTKLLDLLKETLNKKDDVEIYATHIIKVWKYAHKYKDLIETYIIDGNDTAYTTYFHVIAGGNNYDTVKAIINEIKESYPKELNNVIKMKDQERGISLHNAAESGNAETVKLLIENGAFVDAKRKHEWRPIHLAAKNGNLDVLKILIEEKASINSTTGYDYTPLHLASKNGWPDIVKLLLNHKADINAVTKRDETPLHFATKMKRTECAEALLNSDDVDVNVKTEFAMTPLHFATKTGQLKIVRILLRKGADVNVKNHHDFAPLHFAAVYNYLELVEELLAVEDIDVDVQTSKGNTPLHLAAENGNVAIIQALMGKKVKTDIINEDGNTARDLAQDETVKNMF